MPNTSTEALAEAAKESWKQQQQKQTQRNAMTNATNNNNNNSQGNTNSSSKGGSRTDSPASSTSSSSSRNSGVGVPKMFSSGAAKTQQANERVNTTPPPSQNTTQPQVPEQLALFNSKSTRRPHSHSDAHHPTHHSHSHHAASKSASSSSHLREGLLKQQAASAVLAALNISNTVNGKVV